MQTMMITAQLRRFARPDLHAQSVRALNLLRSYLRVHADRVKVGGAPSPIFQKGKVYLAALADLQPPRKCVAHWVARELEKAAPGFLQECVEKQIADIAAKKSSGQWKKTSPLAGVLAGREDHPSLYKGFFDAVKAGVMQARQAEMIRDGITIAGVRSGEAVAVTARDFIDPFTVVSGEGEGDTDLAAESALVRLSRSRMELTRIFDAEEVKSRAEEISDDLSTSAHQEKSVLPHDLIEEVQEKEGIILPWDANVKTLAELASGITDAYLQGRVLEALERGSEVDDTQRTYLHRDGSFAFRCRKSKTAAPWKPFEKTPEKVNDEAAIYDALVEAGVELNPFAGETYPETQKREAKAAPALKVVSQATYDALLNRREQLLQESERIADLMGNALEDGDLRESAAYDEARTLMMENQNAMRVLEDEIASVQVGDVADTNIGKVFVVRHGEELKQFRLTDAQPKIGEVSIASALGQHLVSATIGSAFTLPRQRKQSVKAQGRQPVRGKTTWRTVQAPKDVTVSKLPVSQSEYAKQPFTYCRESVVQDGEVAIQILDVRQRKLWRLK